jgi:hypothetical protein
MADGSVSVHLQDRGTKIHERMIANYPRAGRVGEMSNWCAASSTVQRMAALEIAD